MRAKKQLFLVLILSILSFTANALVLEQAPYPFDPAINDGGDGYLSVGPAGVRVAENFQFSNAVILTSISWWGSYDPVAPDFESFTVQIIEDDGTGNPKPVNFPDFPLYATIFTGSGDSTGLVDLFDVDVFQYKVEGLDWVLQGEATYYLSIFSNTGDRDWYWLQSQAGDNINWFTETNEGAWILDSPDALNMSFRLEAVQVASVSEPATLMLLLIPLLWFVRVKFFNQSA